MGIPSCGNLDSVYLIRKNKEDYKVHRLFNLNCKKDTEESVKI